MSAKVFTVSLAVAVTASWVLLVDGVPPANAAPTSDGQGYVNSTARCGTQDTTVVFGSTDSSRVAICMTPGGRFEYRGVRVRDGAKLIVPAKEAGDGTFEAENYGIVYTVSAKSLVVSQGVQVIREESDGRLSWSRGCRSGPCAAGHADPDHIDHTVASAVAR